MSFSADKWEHERMARLDEALESDPDNVDANYEKGILLLWLCRDEDALACFENVLKQNGSHVGALVGKRRALTIRDDYNDTKACFDRVLDNDEEHGNAAYWSTINDYYKDRRGKQANMLGTDHEERLGDLLVNWMEQRRSDIPNLVSLLDKFRKAKDGSRYKAGHIFHAYLVKKFYENDGDLKITGVECNDIEPKTDVDIRLNDDIYIQAWHGRMPVAASIGEYLAQKIDDPPPLNWCEELRPVQKKLSQLPSKTGKGFVLNFVPGDISIPSPLLHDLCSERKCVMQISSNMHHIIVYGKSCFRYRAEACLIARALGRPAKFLLGDWKEIQSQGHDLLSEASYGTNIWLYKDLFHMDKDELLEYAMKNLKRECYDKLVNMPPENHLIHVLQYLMLLDDDCENEDKQTE